MKKKPLKNGNAEKLKYALVRGISGANQEIGDRHQHHTHGRHGRRPMRRHFLFARATGILVSTRRPRVKENCDERVYVNEGNWPLLRHVPRDANTILDVGCGAGDNASLLKKINPGLRIYGITISEEERKRASSHMGSCITADIELGVPAEFLDLSFDAIVFSHVLEHVRYPSTVLAKFSHLVRPGGVILIAVPNVLHWKQRWQFLTGRFEYTATGFMDSTHLRFFTYFTADKYLLSETTDLKIVSKNVTGSIPLWVARRYIFPRVVSEFCDSVGCRLAPNLFGSQVILVAQKS